MPSYKSLIFTLIVTVTLLFASTLIAAPINSKLESLPSLNGKPLHWYNSNLDGSLFYEIELDSLDLGKEFPGSLELLLRHDLKFDLCKKEWSSTFVLSPAQTWLIPRGERYEWMPPSGKSTWFAYNSSQDAFTSLSGRTKMRLKDFGRTEIETNEGLLYIYNNGQLCELHAAGTDQWLSISANHGAIESIRIEPEKLALFRATYRSLNRPIEIETKNKLISIEYTNEQLTSITNQSSTNHIIAKVTYNEANLIKTVHLQNDRIYEFEWKGRELWSQLLNLDIPFHRTLEHHYSDPQLRSVNGHIQILTTSPFPAPFQHSTHLCEPANICTLKHTRPPTGNSHAFSVHCVAITASLHRG